MEQPDVLPDLIRQARERAGLTQVEAAKRTQLTRATIYNAETGNRSPAGYVLARLARAYGCSMDAFVHEDERAMPEALCAHQSETTPAPLASAASESASGAE